MGATLSRINSAWYSMHDLRASDNSAFESLYLQQRPAVYALALRMSCNHATAEDIVQDVFIAVWRGLRAFRGDSSISTWIHAIAVRTARRRWRQNYDAKLDEGAIAEYERVVAKVFPDTRLDLERAIATLPAGARAVLVLHDVHGHKHAEIAGMLGVAIGTVKAQLHRARNLVKQELQP
jgi:RNA polymerase sigma-70 factor (ECF subfamily)